MIRRCEPLHPGDQHEHCGATFDDLERLAVCPHNPLAGGTDPLPPSTLEVVAGRVVGSRRVYTTTFEVEADNEPETIVRVREWIETKTRPASWSQPTVVVMVSREAAD